MTGQFQEQGVGYSFVHRNLNIDLTDKCTTIIIYSFAYRYHYFISRFATIRVKTTCVMMILVTLLADNNILTLAVLIVVSEFALFQTYYCIMKCSINKKSKYCFHDFSDNNTL